jgi:hypothetical protein
LALSGSGGSATVIQRRPSDWATITTLIGAIALDSSMLKTRSISTTVVFPGSSME